MIRVAVVGASGRMGSTVVRAVQDADDLEFAAGLDADDEVSLAAVAGADVAVEFSVPEASEANVHALIDAGLHTVVGTTGWNDDSLGRVRDHLAEKPGVGVLIAPNFALSAVLAMRFAALAAPYFESAEVIELHHPNKVDAPSGTATHTAHAIAAARAEAGAPPIPDATTTDPEGARGANIGGVHVHAVRLRGMLAHEEILLGNAGEVLSIRQDTLDRTSFMPGVLLGVRTVGSRPGLTVGLDKYMDL